MTTGSRWISILLCCSLIFLSASCTHSAQNASPVAISVPIGTSILNALKSYSAATGNRVYVSPTDMSVLQNQFPAGTYTSDSFLSHALSLVGADSTNVSNESVTFMQPTPTLPPLTSLAPYAAQQQSELDELNGFLSSLSTDDIQKWLAGQSVMHVNSFPVVQQTAFMNLARRLGSGVAYNGQSVDDLSKDPKKFDVEFCVDMQLYLWTPDGNCHTVQLSYTPSSFHDQLLYQISTPPTPTNATDTMPGATISPVPSEVAADTLRGTLVKLPQNNDGYYSLGSLSAAIEQQTDHEVIVDKSLRNRQILILAPNGMVDASDLLTSMAASTGLTWRNINDVIFLAARKEGVDSSMADEIAQKANVANAKLVSFVFQNLPQYVVGLSQEDFMREKRHWSTLPSHEQSLLKQIIPQSPSYATDPGIAKLLNDPQILPDTVVAYGIVASVNLMCNGNGLAQTYNLLGSSEIAD